MSQNKNEDGFDRFIQNFAEKKLEKRVKVVSLLVLSLILGSLIFGCFLLNQSFTVDVIGRFGDFQNNQMSFTVNRKYESLIGSEMKIFVQGESGEKEIYFDLLKIQPQKKEIVVSVQVKVEKQILLKGKKYRLVLEEKTYLSLLMDKSGFR